jgi:hypothetical protein
VPFFYPLEEKTFEDNSIADKRQREKIFGQDDHVRKYGTDYTKRIAQSGLRPVEVKFSESLTNEQAYHFGVSRTEVIYMAIKN